LHVPGNEYKLTLTVCYVVIGLAIGLPQGLLLRRRSWFAHLAAGQFGGVGVGFGLVLAT
jgi:hypothetical protein